MHSHLNGVPRLFVIGYRVQHGIRVLLAVAHRICAMCNVPTPYRARSTEYLYGVLLGTSQWRLTFAFGDSLGRLCRLVSRIPGRRTCRAHGVADWRYKQTQIPGCWEPGLRGSAARRRRLCCHAAAAPPGHSSNSSSGARRHSRHFTPGIRSVCVSPRPRPAGTPGGILLCQ